MVDITEHLYVFNVNMQGCHKLVTEYFDRVRAFQIILSLWEMQLCKHNPVHLPGLKSLHLDHESTDTFICEFTSQFTVFTQLEKDFTQLTVSFPPRY